MVDPGSSGQHRWARAPTPGSDESVRLKERYRNAKILEIFEGVNELQQWIVARELVGRDVTD